MDENRIAGTVRNAQGKAKETVGRVTGDLKKQVEGKLDQAAGAAQEFYGRTADAARDTAVTLDKWLRTTIEAQPYTRRWWHLASAGCSAECIGRFKPADTLAPRRASGRFVPL